MQLLPRTRIFHVVFIAILSLARSSTVKTCDTEEPELGSVSTEFLQHGISSEKHSEEAQVSPGAAWKQEAVVSLTSMMTLPTGQEPRSSHDVFYHVHIPKVAGISFGLDALDILQAKGHKMISREGCFSRPGVPDPAPRDRLVMLRNPAAHVLSMYNFCRYVVNPYIKEVTGAREMPLPDHFDDYVRNWTHFRSEGWSGDFKPPKAKVHPWGPVENMIRYMRMAGWHAPPFALVGDQALSDEDWPDLDGGGTIWHYTKVPFKTYVPMNFQSQRMTCTNPMHFPAEVNMSLAFHNVDKAFHVGIIEAYQPSLCILHAKVHDKLPAFCDCTNEAKWKTFSGHKDNMEQNMVSDKTRIEKPEGLSEDVRKLVNDLTDQDQQLYTHAWERLVREAKWVQNRHGVKVLCDEKQPPMYRS